MNWFMLISALCFHLHAHETNLETIEVTQGESTEGLVGLSPGISKLQGRELIKKRQTSLGDTLSSESGIQSTSFGPNASRPVIRGLDGDRVRILQNGLGTLDASTQSLDHAIPIDVLTVDQIELIRGPMGLLYGPTGTGGVVNVITNRVHSEYEEGYFSKALFQGETASEGLSSAAHLNYGVKKWMFHIDGSTRNLSDMRVPGYVRSRKQRQDSPIAEKETKDKLRGSFNKQNNLATAATRIFSRGHAGLSFNNYNTRYGSIAEEGVVLDMTQNRFEFHSEYRPESGIFRKLKLKSAQSDYFHREISDNQTGTIFKNKGNETRIEAFNKGNNLDGVIGLHSQIFKFAANGDEAFLPTSKNQKYSLFSFQQLSKGKNAYRASARFEDQKTEKLSSSQFPLSDTKRYLGMNASLGHCYDFSKSNSLESSISYTQRAPTFQELYASGDHIATGTFEQGDSTLSKEKAVAYEISFKKNSISHEFIGSAYTQMFEDYIALSPTGTFSTEGFEINNYSQVKAVFYGMELNNRQLLKKLEKGSVFLINKFDWVRAKDIDSGKNLPRISPPRLTQGFDYVTDRWNMDVEVQYVGDQTKTAPLEKRTKYYYMTNLGCTYSFVGSLSSIDLFARVRNIFDIEARNHVSTLKDVAPLAGRNFIIGAQFQM